MKLPSKKEADWAEYSDFTDDGFAHNFDEKDPWSIQNALDDIRQDLRICEQLDKDFVFEWESGRNDRRGKILNLVQKVRKERELVQMSKNFDNLHDAIIELEEAQSVHQIEQEEYDENRKYSKLDIALKERQIAVLEDLLERSLCGDN